MQKIRQEYEDRKIKNDQAVDTLEQNLEIWLRVQGPSLGSLRAPSGHALALAREAKECLEKMKEHYRDSRCGTDSFCSHCIDAAGSLRSLELAVIREEKFHLTPEGRCVYCSMFAHSLFTLMVWIRGLFMELAANALKYVDRERGEAERRHRMLNDNSDINGADVQHSASVGDMYSCNPDRFKEKHGKKPRDWKKAVAAANVVHIDEMRTLLEIHYNDCFYERWQQQGREGSKPGKRKSEYKLFKSVISSFKRPLCERMSLPASIKHILRKTADEEDWDKIEEVRSAVVCAMQGEMDLLVDDDEEANELSAAIERAPLTEPWNAVGEGFGGLPAGSQILARRPKERPEHWRACFAEAVRQLHPGTALRVRTRPINSAARAPPICNFGKRLALTTEAGSWQTSSKILAKRCGDGRTEDIHAFLDQMLLCLWDALHLDMAIKWSTQKVSNLTVDDAPEIARYFIKGWHVSDQPLFHGMCAFCACLLHGMENEQGAGSNTRSGHPIDKDGKQVSLEGKDITEIQPPALLRYSPALFAKEAPEVFVHDPVTNVLGVKPEKDEPWIKPNSQLFLYCVDCHDRFISAKENNFSFVPFRDKASQSLLRPTWLERKRQIEAAQEEASADAVEDSQDPGLGQAPAGDDVLNEVPPDERLDADDVIVDFQPPDEDDEGQIAGGLFPGGGIAPAVVRELDGGVATPLAGSATDDEDAAPVAGDDDADGEPPPADLLLPEAMEKAERPTLEEYKEKWETLKAQHVRAPGGDFEFDNLVPEPNWRLFQDCWRLSMIICCHPL